jgi:hypothetical protein
VANDVVIGMRVFRQRVDDQIVTLFGVRETRAALGPLLRGNRRRRRPPRMVGQRQPHVAEGVRASIDYTQASARWSGSWDEPAISRVAPLAVRDDEHVHDVTASFEAVVAPTSTRVFALYK